MKLLSRSFYNRDSVIVAKELLGKIVMRSIDGHVLSGMIVETEAYKYGDKASHCYSRKTKRNEALFGPPGHAYIYMIHNKYCFNTVAHDSETPAGGVLIRALQPLQGIELMQKNRNIDTLHALTNGPGKLTQALEITKKLYGVDITKKGPLYIIEKETESFEIVTTTRIGISQEKEKKWRFYIANNSWVSKKIKRK